MKKSTLLILGAGTALAATGLLVAASMQPEDYQLERSAVLRTTPEDVYSFISDFQNYRKWSPWEKLDPNLQTTISGQPGDIGTCYEWSGNSKAGQGRITIVRAEPNEEVELELEFVKPFPATSSVFWILRSTDEGTEMTWRMHGRNSSLMSKLMGLIFDFEKMIGKDFDEGLSNLKRLLEH